MNIITLLARLTKVANLTDLSNLVREKIIAFLNSLGIKDNLKYICIILIAVVVFVVAAKRLLNMGLRMLMGILALVFVFFAAPKINTFLINRIGEYGIIERQLSRIVDGDIETKIKREYRIKTGQVLTDDAVVEQIKNEQYQIDPNLSDELNILAHAGLPSGIMNTLLVNFADWGTSTITASTFSDYVAKFFILRIVMLISYIIAFSVGARIFTTEKT